MTNLLPSDSRRPLRALYRSRFILVGSLALISSAFVALLALTPAYVIVRGGNASPEPSNVPTTFNETADLNGIGRARALLSELRTVGTSTAPITTLLEEVLPLRPKGVLVQRIDIVRGEKGMITISGEAPSRDAINAYREILSEYPRIESVSIPLDVLAGAESGRFSLIIRSSL